MSRPLVCLTLTGKTLAEDVAMVNKYKSYIDIAELRADYLDDNERLLIRAFPQMVGIPCILTIRRKIDGGEFLDGEANRTILFARALAFADEDKRKNFEYIDFEEDFRVPSLQDAALAFGIKTIRSVHSMDKPIENLTQRLESLSNGGLEIPKIAFMPKSLDDVTKLFNEASELKDSNHILIAMGPLGLPSRILSAKLKNYLTFTSPIETASNTSTLAHLDPITLNDVYNFKNINESTNIFGITGWPLTSTSSPIIHNNGYKSHNMNNVYIPLKAERVEQAIFFANCTGIKGLSVTVPHKEQVLRFVQGMDEKVNAIGASNTIVKQDDEWLAYNTDASGFAKSLTEFTGLKNLRGKKVAIIGAGGAARAICYAVKKLHGKACIFNRTVSKAKNLAKEFGFKYASLGTESLNLLRKYSNVIIQTTSKGMNQTGEASEENDPIFFYDFTGREMLFDIIYVPSSTPVMTRAALAGCKVCNGYNMLKYQGYEQFELFTGQAY